MRLKVYLPKSLIVDEEVSKVVAEAENGSFGLLPKHIDFVTTLVPGIMSFVKEDSGDEWFAAIDEGVLVKCGENVTVSTRKAAVSQNLGQLQKQLEEQFLTLDEQERKTRAVIAKLETDFVRGVLKLK